MTNAQSIAPENFSWGRLIIDMRLRGLPLMIACHTEPFEYDAAGPSLRLEVNQTLQELHDSPAMARLKEALVDRFGSGLKLEVIFGPAAGSPAAIAYDKRVGRYSKAYASLAGDALVASLIEEFGAKVIVESVRPVRRNGP